MNLDTLFDLITDPKWYNGTSLQLPCDAIDGNGSIYSLINTWCGNTLSITGIIQQPKKVNNTVPLSGVMSLLNVNNQVVNNIVFSIIDKNGQPAKEGDPALFIEFPLPGNWTFALSFPLLAETFFSNLNFQSSAFLLSSYEQKAGPVYPALKPGLNFSSASLFTNDGILGKVTSLLGTGQLISISGAIGILAGNIYNLNSLQPGIDISSPVQNIPLASFLTLPVSLACKTFIIEPSKEFSAELLLISQITIGTEPPIQVSVDISNLGKVLVFDAGTADFAQHTLEQLADFLNNAPVGEELKKYVKDLSKYVTLKGIRIYLTTSLINKNLSQAFSAVAVDIGTISEWDVLPGYFNLEKFDATFMVNNIVTNPQITTIVNGDVKLVDGIELLLSASFPDPSFDVQLEPDSTIQLSQLLKKFFPEASGFPDLVCNELDVSGTPGENIYALSAGFTGDWKINSGIREIKLVQAVLTLNYDESNSPSTSGSIDARAQFITDSKSESINEFDVTWAIPGNFQLQGNFPDIDLTKLAVEIVNEADLSLPADFPQLNLKNCQVTFAVLNPQGGNQPQGTEYDFSLTAEVDIDNTSLGLVFEIQKNDLGWGCITGIWTSNWQWSPAQQWPSVFGDILEGIAFSKTGLIISSIVNPSVTLKNPPSPIPATIGKGVTFFTSIDFGGSALKVLHKFFPDANGISFYAYLAIPLSNSEFIGQIGTPSATQKYSFDGLLFIISPANKSFSLQTGVTFSFTEIAGPNKGNTVKLDFVGGGTLNLEGEFDLYFVLRADVEMQNVEMVKRLQQYTNAKLAKQLNLARDSGPGWKDPLGLQGITIEDFWGEVGVSAEGELFFGFGGNVGIGETDPVELEMDLVGGVLDGGVPELNAFVFKLIETDKTKAIQLTSLIQEFTTLNVSWVPVLNGISFKEFQLYIVLDPNGWINPATHTLYNMGFYSSGDIIFYGFEAVFDIEIYFNTGIKASGYVNKPLSLAGGLVTLSNAQADKGPYGLIDTTAINSPDPDKPYLILSGSITVLGISDTLYAYIKEGSFYIDMTLHQYIFTEHLICSLHYSGSSFSFFGSVGGSIGLHVNTPDVVEGGLTIIPALKIDFDLDLTCSLSINPGFQFNVSGSFSFGTLTLTVDFNLIDITSWNDLKDDLEDFFEKYPKELFRDLLDKMNVKKWIDALKQGLFNVGEDVTTILHQYYQVSAELAAELLNDLNWAAEDIEDALENVWGKSKKEAEKIVSEISNFCSVISSYGLLNFSGLLTVRPDVEMLQSLSNLPGAQEMLYRYYLCQNEINAICSTDAVVRKRLVRMLQDHLPGKNETTPAIEDIITLMNIIQKKGTSKLQNNLDSLITLLRRYRKDTYIAFMTKMQVPGYNE
ncbi:hypothetical protein FAM09_23105 [Niastella caeni]|uniref:Uncharacterized protein n=1 Tax=Niastella caeni TaxID=2569763 RepID=A0A4S8HM70_9BACT|nr:hypothetical protein [Niastella caeni]THU34884.1 hypothetical protein FAM09_23105 [Niastella caeni]